MRSLPLHLLLLLLSLLGEVGDDEGDDDEHQGAPVVVQRQDIGPVKEAACDDESAEERGDQCLLFSHQSAVRMIGRRRNARRRFEHQDCMEVVGQKTDIAGDDEDDHPLLFGKGSHDMPPDFRHISYQEYKNICI